LSRKTPLSAYFRSLRAGSLWKAVTRRRAQCSRRPPGLTTRNCRKTSSWRTSRRCVRMRTHVGVF